MILRIGVVSQKKVWGTWVFASETLAVYRKTDPLDYWDKTHNINNSFIFELILADLFITSNFYSANTKIITMNAYDVLEKTDEKRIIDERQLNNIKVNFQKDYLKSKNYFERKAKHRNPIEVENDVLREIYDYLIDMQSRKELIHTDAIKKSQEGVIGKVADIWKSNKTLKSCYNSIQEYCKISSKDFNTIAVHVIEYRALSKLAIRLERSKHANVTYKLKNVNRIEMKTNNSNENAEMLLNAESFQNTLVSIATGSKGEETEYKRLRDELYKHVELTDVIPGFVKTNRTAAQFWQFIKFEFSSYAERRNYIWNEFSSIFNYLEGKNKGVPDDGITKKIEKFNQQYIQTEWRKALTRKSDDPEGAITSSRTLIETTCKFILDDLSVTYKDDLELPKLYKLTADNLNLAPDQHTEQIFKQILGSCQAVVDGLGALRNKLSDSHGKRVTQIKPSQRHAELAVNLSGALTTFLLETYEFKKQKAI